MGKKTLCNGAYVRVNVDRPFRRHLQVNDWLVAAKDLEKEISHCDGVESTSLELDSEEICEFCGYAWTNGPSLNNDQCCEKDVAEAEVRDRHPM